MDDSCNIRSLSPDKGKISKQSFHFTCMQLWRSRPAQDEELLMLVRGERGGVMADYYLASAYQLLISHENKFRLLVWHQLCTLLLFTRSQIVVRPPSLPTHAHILQIFAGGWCLDRSLKLWTARHSIKMTLCCCISGLDLLIISHSPPSKPSPAQPCFKGGHQGGSVLLSKYSCQSPVVLLSTSATETEDDK